MRHLRLAMVLLASALALPWAAGEEADPEPDWSEVHKLVRAAFQPLALPPHPQIEKEVEGELPQGIVIEAQPFDSIIDKLLARHEPRMTQRAHAVRAVRAVLTPKAGKLLKSGLGVLGKENQDLLYRIASMEAEYAECWDRGYMEASEPQRRTRKMAAVMIPFYRRLALRNEEISAGMVETLAGMSEGENLEWLMEAATRDSDPLLRQVAAQALARVPGAEATDALRRVLEKDKDATVRSRALAALVSTRKIFEVTPVILASLEDEAWEVRALAILIIVRANLVEATGPLIEALARETGRLRKDIDEALFALVGVRMYGDVGLWETWWSENKDEVAAKAASRAAAGEYDRTLGPLESWLDEPGAEAGPEEEQGKGVTAAFYGIPTFSKRILFIVDISQSMEEPAGALPVFTGSERDPYSNPDGNRKIDIARWQLHRAVQDLPDDAVCNIAVYSESYKLWQAQVIPMNRRHKPRAHQFIDGLQRNGTTNISDPLDKAFEVAGAAPLAPLGRGVKEMAVDTVFLLSDGEPNRGRITDLGALLQDLARRNRYARMVIHTIGIGEAEGSSFLRSVARQTGGRYVGFR